MKPLWNCLLELFHTITRNLTLSKQILAKHEDDIFSGKPCITYAPTAGWNSVFQATRGPPYRPASPFSPIHPIEP